MPSFLSNRSPISVGEFVNPPRIRSGKKTSSKGVRQKQKTKLPRLPPSEGKYLLFVFFWMGGLLKYTPKTNVDPEDMVFVKLLSFRVSFRPIFFQEQTVRFRECNTTLQIFKFAGIKSHNQRGWKHQDHESWPFCQVINQCHVDKSVCLK